MDPGELEHPSCVARYLDQQNHRKRMKFSLRTFSSPLFVELLLRFAILTVFIILESAPPFERTIQQEELWLYKHPITNRDAVPTYLLLIIALGVPMAFISANYFATKDKSDFIQATLCFSLTALLTGTVLNVIKISVGRPRPDFFFRCFPNGEVTSDLHCTGDLDMIQEGRKSFPSGHTGWMFACFGFLSLYLSGKLQCFRPPGRSQGWRLCATITPLVAACVVGISRMQDHKHHWDDVIVGALIGFLGALLCYHHYYPPAFHLNCHYPYSPQVTDPEMGLTIKNSNITRA